MRIANHANLPDAIKEYLAARGTALPAYVEQEFEAYLQCGRPEHGFLRVRCDGCHVEHLVAFCSSTGCTSSVPTAYYASAG
jgi:hypothetical protein